MIEPADADPVEVRGELRNELLRLDGAQVEASGTRTASGHLDVGDYAVVEIAGFQPVVGILTLVGDDLAVSTQAGDVVVVRQAPADLKAQAGAKVWVILDENGVVQGYGVIREP
jgi:hypothetical protein